MNTGEAKPTLPAAPYTEEGFTFRPQFQKKSASAAEMYRTVETLAAGDSKEEERMLKEIDELEDLPIGSRQMVITGATYLKVTKRSEDNPGKKQSAEYEIEHGTFGA